jgi:hypothetical protein
MPGREMLRLPHACTAFHSLDFQLGEGMSQRWKSTPHGCGP